MLCILKWTENILKTKLFDNDDVTAKNHVISLPRLPQIQIQNDRAVLSVMSAEDEKAGARKKRKSGRERSGVRHP